MGRCGKVFSSGYQESREVWALAHVGIDASLTNYLRDLDHKQLKQGIRQSHFRDSFYTYLLYSCPTKSKSLLSCGRGTNGSIIFRLIG